MAEDKTKELENKISELTKENKALRDENDGLKKDKESHAKLITELNQEISKKDDEADANSDLPEFTLDKKKYVIKAKSTRMLVEGAFKNVTAEDIKGNKDLQKLLVEKRSGIVGLKNKEDK